MSSAARPYRSVLYIPASRARALEKAQTLACDAIIFDLEDAVAPDAKAEARDTLVQWLSDGDYGARAGLVRINGNDTEWYADDLAALCPQGPEAILLPKVNSAKDIIALAEVLDSHPTCAGTKIWAMMETPQGILNAADIAASHPRFAGMVMGTNDLLKDLGGRSVPDRGPMVTALSLCVLAARAHGLTIVDGVYNAFKDEAGLAAECKQGRDMGFDGKTLIHPAQLEVANAAFAPSEDEIALAERQIAAFEEVEAAGQGVAVVDGAIVENLHVETARNTLAKARAIAAL